MFYDNIKYIYVCIFTCGLKITFIYLANRLFKQHLHCDNMVMLSFAYCNEHKWLSIRFLYTALYADYLGNGKHMTITQRNSSQNRDVHEQLLTTKAQGYVWPEYPRNVQDRTYGRGCHHGKPACKYKTRCHSKFYQPMFEHF